MQALLERPEVVGFGEVGLDWHHEQRAGRSRQEKFFEQLLEALKDTIIARNLPIVLHLRHDGLARHEEIAARAQTILRKTVGQKHPIQLHYFTGSAKDVTQWIEAFPNVMFSLAVGTLRGAQAETETGQMIQAIPQNKLLLETDSPYGINNGHINVPYNIPACARAIADLRECTLNELLDSTLHNTARFFKD